MRDSVWTFRSHSRRACAILLAVCLSAPALAGPGPSVGSGRRILPDYKTIVLRNGLTLLVMEHHELPLVNFRLLVKAGTAADPKGREGLASLTADLLRQGTRAKTAMEFSEAVDFLGGVLEAEADRDRTLVSGEFLARDFTKGLDLTAEMVLSPAFREEEVERTRQQTLARIQQELDDPETIADKQFARFLYGDHPYARPPEGTPSSLPAVRREEIVGFYRDHYLPNETILAIVGDISEDTAIAAAKKAFGGWPRKSAAKPVYPPPPTIKGRRVFVVDKPDVNQSQIRMGTIGIKRSDPSYFTAQIAATILGGGFTSWLNQEIREKRGLSYGASARFDPRLAPGPFVVSTFTKHETVKETITVALDTLRRFRSGEFTEDDLRKAQNYRAGQYPLSVETTSQLSAQIVDLVFYGLGRDFVDRQIERLRAVTLADLKAFAPRIPVDDYVMVVVTNASGVRPQLEDFGKIEVLPLSAAGEDAPRSGGATR